MTTIRLISCLALLGISGFGAAEAPEVTIQVYSDFQCPYCKEFAEPVHAIAAQGVEGVTTKVEFKNFPLGFHKFAQLAAQAAAAAGAQGKFWEMHDVLFANQNALGREDLMKYAGTVKLDMGRFAKDLDSEAIRKQVEADLADGAAKKVQGTPTFFVNGKEYSGAKTLEQLQALVRADAGRRVAMAEVTDSMMSQGPAGAPVTIEFYADLESPVTPMASRVIEALMAKYPSQVRLQFRNFPLSFHPQAPVTHCAAMTAAREGHFWEMANYVLAHQESIREQDLIAYAGKLGMDAVKFAESVRKRRYLPRVDFDVEEGQKRGLRGSPVVFVVAGGDSNNAKRIDGVPSMEMLVEYVNAALAPKSIQTAGK